MENEIVILKKKDLEEIFDKFNLKVIPQILSTMKNWKNSKNSSSIIEDSEVKRLNTRQIKDMLGIGDTTFEKVQGDLPLHRTKTGRLFGYRHDIIIYMFTEHPPYFDYKKLKEYLKQENLMKYLSQSK